MAKSKSDKTSASRYKEEDGLSAPKTLSAEEQAEKLKAQEKPLSDSDVHPEFSETAPIGWQTALEDDASKDGKDANGSVGSSEEQGAASNAATEQALEQTSSDAQASDMDAANVSPSGESQADTEVMSDPAGQGDAASFTQTEQTSSLRSAGAPSPRPAAVDGAFADTPSTDFQGSSTTGGSGASHHSASGGGGGGSSAAAAKGNTPALIAGMTTGDIDEDGTPDKISGQLYVSDPDAGQSHFRAGTIGGTYGTLNIDANGQWTYALDNARPEVQGIAGGATVSDVLTVTTADGTTQDLTISVHGEEDTPVLVAQAQTVAEGGTVISGQMVATDADTGQILAFSIGGPVVGLTMNADGSYTFDPGNPAYDDLAEGQPKIISVPVTVSDPSGNTDTKVLTLTVTGTNDQPVLAVSPPQSFLEGAAVYTGQLMATDPDTGDVLTFSLDQPVHGLTLNADGSYTFDPDDTAYDHMPFGQSAILSFKVTVTDNHGASDTRSMQISVTGTNDHPIMSLVPPSTVDEGAHAVHGQLQATDVDDGDTLTYALVHPIAGVTVNTDGTYTFDPANPVYNNIPDGDQRVLSIPVTVTDRFGATDQQSIQITVQGTNDVPVVGGIDHSIAAVSAATGGFVRASGSLVVLDLDQGESHFISQVLNGQYGSLGIGPDGSWTYTADASQSTFAAMPQGGHVDETFTVKTADGTTHDISIRVVGSNQPAIIAGTKAGMVSEDQPGAITRHLMISDPDAGQAAFVPVDHDQLYGHFTLAADGTWTYQVDNGNPAVQSLGAGEPLTEKIVVGSVDGTPQIITVTIVGTNDVPVIGGVNSAVVTEDVAVASGDLTASGQLTITDADAGEGHFSVFSGFPGSDGHGTFSIDANGHWTYTADNGQAAVQELKTGQHLTDSFQAVSADGTKHTVTVTIEGADDAPVLQAQSQSVTEDGALLQGQMQATDADASETLTYSTTATIDGFTLNADGSYTFDPGDNAYQSLHDGELKPLTIPVTVTDSTGLTSTQDLNIVVTGAQDTAVISEVHLHDHFSAKEDTGVRGAGKLQCNGNLVVADADAGEGNAFPMQHGSTTYGTFLLAPSGEWGYVADNAQPSIQQLGDGQSLTDSFTIHSADGTPHTITVTIEGTNDVPTVTATSATPADLGATDEDIAKTFTEPDLLQLVGAADVDGDALHVTGVSIDASAGTFAQQPNGDWVFTPVANFHGDNLPITLTVNDGNVDTTAHGTLDVTSIADTAVIGGDVAKVTLDDDIAVSGILTVADGDAGEDHFVDQTDVDGQYGKFRVTADGHWTYTPDDRADAIAPGRTPQETFTVHSADGTAQTVTVTVSGTNDAPEVTATQAAPVNLGVTDEDTTKTFAEADLLQFVGATDVDAGDMLSISDISVDAAVGSFAKGAAGAWVFTPAADHHGDDIDVTINVSDGMVETTAHGVLDVTPVTDAAAPSLTIMAEQNVMAFAPNSASGIVNSDTIRAGGAMHGITIDMTILGGQQATSSASHGATFISYATPSDSNAMYIWKPEDLTFRIGGQEYATGVAMLTDGHDHRYTFSWDGVHGTLDVLIDGQVAAHLNNVGQGATLADGGKLALGNDQDSFGGGFSTADAFSGQVFNAAMAKTAADPAALAKSSLANLLHGDPNLLTDVQAKNGQFVDTTGNHHYTTVGAVTVETVEVDTAIATPNPGATLKISIDAGAPADTDDAVTGQILTGFPAGTVVSDGHSHSVTVSGPAELIDVAGWTLASLQAVPPASFHANMNVGYMVTTTGPDGVSATATDYTPVILDPSQPVPDAIISGDDSSTTPDDDTAISGTLTITDTDASQAHFIAQSAVGGQFGTFDLDADGHWTYTPDARADSIANGQSPQETFTVHSADGTVHNVTITVTGTNDAPIVIAADTAHAADFGALPEDTQATFVESDLLLALGATDVDSAALSVTNINIDPQYGTISQNANGAWEFVPTANFSGNDIPLTITISDGTATTDAHAKFDITAVNDAASFAGDDHLTTKEDVTSPIRGTLSISDPDAGEAQLALQVHVSGAGGYGHFTILPTGVWNYQLDNTSPDVQQLAEHQTLTDSLVVTSTDGTQHTVTVTIEGTDDAPVISGDTTAGLTEDSRVTATGALAASGTLTGTDIDAGETTTFVAEHILGDGGYGVFSIDAAGNWQYLANNNDPKIQGLKAGEPVTDSAEVTTSEGVKQTITVTITGANDAPTVSAAVGHQTATEDTPLIFSETAVLSMVGALDADSDTLHVTGIDIDPKLGEFAHRADGSWIFTPASQVSGHDLPVSIQISDGVATSSAQGMLDITAVADTPSLQVTVDSLAHPSVNSYTIADFSGAGEPVDFDLTASGYQIPGEHQAAGYYAVTTATGGTADDVFRFSDLQGGQAYHVDGAQGSNVLDFSSYHADDVRIDTAAKTVTVTLPDGSTAIVNYDNIDQFRFSEQVFDGSPHGLTPVSGHWVAEGAQVESTGGGPMQTSIVNFQGKLDTDFTLAATVNAHHAEAGHQYTNGGIVFDYEDEQNFKVAFLRVGMKSWTIESFENGHKTEVERVYEPVLTTADADHHVELRVHGSVAELWSGGVMKASHDFHEPLNDGLFGVVADRAQTAFQLEMQPSDWAPSAPDLEILMGAQDGSVTTTNVLAQAVDPEGHPVTLSNVQSTTAHGGTIIDNGDGTFRYEPAAGFTGQDSFTYEVTDGTNVTTASVRVNIANIHTVTGIHPGDGFTVNVGSDTVDNSETLTTRLYGLPDGSTVTDGTHTATVSSGDHLDVSDWALQSITVTPPADQTVNYQFNVETRSTDGSDTSPWVSTPLRIQLQPHVTTYADATIVGDSAQSTDEDSSVSGTLTITDADAGEDHFVAQQDTDGSYGAFSIDASGHWTYTPDDRADALHDQDLVTETFVVQSADGSVQHVEITVTGTSDAPHVAPAPMPSQNDAPLDDGVDQSAFQMDADLAAYTVDPDAPGDAFTLDLASVVADINGADLDIRVSRLPAGSIVSDGVNSETVTETDPGVNVSGWDLDSVMVTPPDNQDSNYAFIVKAQPLNGENASGWTTQEIKVELVPGGAYPNAHVDGDDTGIVDGSTPIGGTLDVSDADTGEAHFQAASLTGNFGSFNIDDNGQWTYAPDERAQQLNDGDQVNDRFSILTADGTSHHVVVSLAGGSGASVVQADTSDAANLGVPDIGDSQTANVADDYMQYAAAALGADGADMAASAGVDATSSVDDYLAAAGVDPSQVQAPTPPPDSAPVDDGMVAGDGNTAPDDPSGIDDVGMDGAGMDAPDTFTPDDPQHHDI